MLRSTLSTATHAPPALRVAFTQSSTVLSFTGAAQSYTVPDGVYLLDTQVYGAEGGQYRGAGGRGGITRACVPVEPGAELLVYVGQAGASAGYCNYAGAVFSGGAKKCLSSQQLTYYS